MSLKLIVRVNQKNEVYAFCDHDLQSDRIEGNIFKLSDDQWMIVELLLLELGMKKVDDIEGRFSYVQDPESVFKVDIQTFLINLSELTGGNPTFRVSIDSKHNWHVSPVFISHMNGGEFLITLPWDKAAAVVKFISRYNINSYVYQLMQNLTTLYLSSVVLSPNEHIVEKSTLSNDSWKNAVQFLINDRLDEMQSCFISNDTIKLYFDHSD